MKITKAKLIKGEFLEVSFSDDNAEVHKSYPSTEAPPILKKAFMGLNSHLTDLTEQYDQNGVADYDRVACRGYSVKGDGEKETVVLTGVRTLSNDRSVTLNSPIVSTDISESSYIRIKSLVTALEHLREQIITFMDNNKSQEEIQGNLFRHKPQASPENTILKSKEPESAVDIIFKDINDASDANALTPEEMQDNLDIEMPLTDTMKAEAANKLRIRTLKALAKERGLTPNEQVELQELNALSKKPKK